MFLPPYCAAYVAAVLIFHAAIRLLPAYTAFILTDCVPIDINAAVWYLLKERRRVRMLLMAVFIIPMLILTGAIKNKYADIYNPITKDNNDYGYMGIEFTKTRNIFEKT